MVDSPRILILTAAFGEGHNSAARNLALALDAAGAQTLVNDPCSSGAPRLTRLLAAGYRLVTTHAPRIWAWIYHSTDRYDFSRRRSPVMRGPERALDRIVDQFNPTAIVSTYPLYPYFLHDRHAGSVSRPPVFTVVTDSIEINAAWLRAPGDWWLVTDPATRDAVVAKGLPAARVVDTGFPVHPAFAQLPTIQPDDPCTPFRVLYFPTAKLPMVRRHSRALLETAPGVTLTIVLGRNVRRLYARAREIKQAYPGRVRLIGWTRRVPQLLASHHLVVGKAGGATVHEALAACCPMLIHHLVPGQEEGNLKLLEQLGGGAYAPSPATIQHHLAGMLANHAQTWRTMKANLADHGRNAGAITAARFIIAHASAAGPRV